MNQAKNNLLHLTIDQLRNLAPHSLSIQTTFEQIQSQVQGLSQSTAEQRLKKFGLNKLKEKKSFSLLKLLVHQFNNWLIILLLFAGFFSYFIGEKIDSCAIFGIIILNALLGFIQEYKAEKSIASLKKIEKIQSRVLRDNQEQNILAENLVPGDVIVLDEGNQIPADARIMESFSLEVDESMLTGESIPVSKHHHILDRKISLPDRKNMLYAGTTITRGIARAVVILTGMNTQVGKIAHEIQKTISPNTPLQQALARLGRLLGIISLSIALPGTLLGFLTGRDQVEMMMLAVSLAVSAIPEGLPIVVTIALAIGIKRMVKVQVLIRKLATAESLGGVDVICSDKTGTITQNKMTVKSIYLAGDGLCEVADQLSPAKTKEIEKLAQGLILCSEANINFGDPTERALINFARTHGLNEDELRATYQRQEVIPFNSRDKFMAVVMKQNQQLKAYLKGAPEVVLSMSKLSPQELDKYTNINNDLSSQGLRVLALAEKNIKDIQEFKQKNNYQFKALFGIHDPPREEVKGAIFNCHQAGIRVMMLTGDHKETAFAIATQIGLDSPTALTGAELETLTEKEFQRAVQEVNIIARVAPEHKVRILQTLQTLGHQVAMTGDGVNDAAAVKKADIGIAVGSGTDLTKGVSDMILLDDNFANIVNGIKEGRRIFYNIKKFVRFLISANFDEIARILLSLIFGLPLSLLPIQILWLNLVTDSFPALALSMDTAEPDIMKQKPYRSKDEILKGIIPFSILASTIACVVIFSLFLIALFIWHLDLRHAQTLSFTSTVLFEFFLVFAIRSEKSVLKFNPFTNRYLWLSLVIGLLLQIAVIYLPIMQQFFKTVPLNFNDWVVVLISAMSGLMIIESLKIVRDKVRQR